MSLIRSALVSSFTPQPTIEPDKTVMTSVKLQMRKRFTTVTSYRVMMPKKGGGSAAEAAAL